MIIVPFQNGSGMTTSPGDEKFPTHEDIRVHKGASTKQKKEQIAFSKRAADITTLEELVAFIFEVGRKRYRKGERKIDFLVEVPIENFIEWAHSVKIIDEKKTSFDTLDRIALRQALTRRTQRNIRGQLQAGAYFTLTCRPDTEKLVFTARFTMITGP